MDIVFFGIRTGITHITASVVSRRIGGFPPVEVSFFLLLRFEIPHESESGTVLFYQTH